VGSIAVVASSSSPPEPEAALRMLRAAPHRGTVHETVSRGNALLAVANRAEVADAWLADGDGLTAALSGSLDNEDELRAVLARGAAPLDANPAATLLAAFRAWGEEAPGRLRGRFAAAVTDGSTVWCFRDHLGFRTLFYREQDGLFLAASEGKQIAAGAGIPRRADADAVADIFFGRLEESRTALAGVSRLPKASLAKALPGEPARIRRYWDPSALLETARLADDEVGERLAELLERVISRTVTGSDAVSLSGGIDSPTVAAFAAARHVELSGRRLVALTAVYPEQPSVDERRYVELVSEYLDLPLETYVPSTRPLDDVERWVDLLDGPVDTLPIPEVAENYRIARGLGARTVLTGELAEFVFTVRQHLPGHLLLHGRVPPFLRWVREQRARGRSHRWVGRQLAPSLAPAFLATRVVQRRGGGHPLLAPWIDTSQVGGSGFRHDLARPARRRWAEAQLDPLRAGVVLTAEADDICAAACGVEVRRPLADVDLWEFFLSLPAEQKFPDSVSKGLVRRTMAGRLPVEILERRDKTAFDAHYLAAADYPALRRLVLDGEHRLPGVDYEDLRLRLESESMDVFELSWASDLARAHAFLRVLA
jgi:asparagine synthase (glutamine-hydrolysing)